MRVGVLWDSLARQPDLLRRIAEASGSEPAVWDGVAPAPDVEALISEDIPPDFIPDQTPRLRLLQLGSAGVDTLRGHPVWRSDVQVATASGVHGVQISEHVMMLLLALRRNLRRFMDAQHRHDWDDGAGTPGELYGLTVALVGYGHIGSGVAHLARAFGMRVVASTPSVRASMPLLISGVSAFVDRPAAPPKTEALDELWPLDRLHDLLAIADVIVICAPLTPRTAGMISAEAFKHIKPGAYLINIARGKIIDETALVQALRDGVVAGAGLDVTDEEPLPRSSPLWDIPNVIITPHISGRSDHYVERTVNIFLANLDCLRRGVPALTSVARERGY
jgi:phosphoglycerate dehydrogenase-like enzyme